jgi:nicotinamide-nucleotide amidase
MPGVPKEMKLMFTRDALPAVRAAGGGAAILSRTLHTFGLGESAIAELLGDLMKRDRNPSVGTTVSGGVVSLRVNSRFSSVEEARQNLESTVELCRTALGDLIYGEDEQTLQAVVGGMLTRRHPRVTVTTAESCTGGLLAKMLTDIPGSSAYFHRGWVTYSNEAKHELLGVPSEVLATHGAVSEATVMAMAGGARSLANADYALAISGIAGPDGGTVDKPVGTTWIAIAHAAGVSARHFIFPGDREFVRERAAKMALTMLRFQLLGKPMRF